MLDLSGHVTTRHYDTISYCSDYGDLFNAVQFAGTFVLLQYTEAKVLETALMAPLA